MTPQNGSSDWAAAFAAFHSQHRDAKGKKLKYTAVFNATMEAFIAAPEVDLEWRFLAWLWRYAWGNDSDYAVAEIGGSPLGQTDAAGRFGVDKRRISDCAVFLRGLNFLKSQTGQKLYPVDDPSSQLDPKDPKSPGPSGLFREFCEEWKVQFLADFDELRSAEETVNRIKKDRLDQFRSWKRGRTNGQSSLLEPTSQTINEPSSSSVRTTPDTAAVTTTTSTGTGTATARAREPEPSVMTPAQDLAQKMGIDPKAAETILRDSRKAEPSVTVDELVVLATMKRDQIAGSIRHGKVTNLVGLLIKAIPNMVSGPDLAEARRRIQQQARQAQTEVEQADVCQQCSDTGFTDGFAWSTLQEAKAHWDAGGRLCSCPAGQQVKQFVGGES